MNLNDNALRDRLTHFLTQAANAPVAIDDITPFAGGSATRTLWSVQTRIGVHPQTLILQFCSLENNQQLTVEQEFAILRAAKSSGIAVPRPRFVCSSQHVVGNPFFVMDKVPTTEVPHSSLQWSEQVAAQLAHIHRLDPVKHKLGFLPVPRAAHSPAQERIAQCYEMLDTAGLHDPAWIFILRWVEQHMPRTAQQTFVHGDYHVHNFIMTDGNQIVIADWEQAHMGDPLEDLAFCCLRYWRTSSGTGSDTQSIQREAFLKAYEQLAATKLNRSQLHIWELIGTASLGIRYLARGQRFLSGHTTDIREAQAGCKSAELRLEALRLIEVTGV
jgi:aminoglycoside phosphotransferase (APT) family kinase protein